MLLRRLGRCLAAALVLAGLAGPATAATTPAPPTASGLQDVSNQWLPNPPDASWTYAWSDDSYAKPTLERYTVADKTYAIGPSTGGAFGLRWTTDGLGNPTGAVSGSGTIEYARTDAGLDVLNWSSTPPPAPFPILCASLSGCGNSLSSVGFMLIWGARSPLLSEPLLRGTTWSSTGGARNDVTSENRYLGVEKVVVPAYPNGVMAAVVQSDITQAGALGDPYGSGLRTAWWVRGVGPVKIDFRHVGGDEQQASLQATNVAALRTPSDTNYFPLVQGKASVFHYSNSRYLPTPSTQQFTVGQAVNGTARIDVKNLGRAGPIRVAGSYVVTTRLSGVTNLSALTRATTKAHFPGLGPSSAPVGNRRRFFTAYDLMTFGFGPILPAYPAVGDTWHSSTGSRDYHLFGVSGVSRIIGVQRVRTPAGTFPDALVVASTLYQRGFRFGSGERRSYFAAGVGLVKLVFRHRDGSVSTVERVH